MMVNWKVVRITKDDASKFVDAKHYSRKMPIFWAGFGLVLDGLVQGVAVYGQPSPQLQKHAFKDRDFRFFELSRLVVQTKEKNAASFLISKSLNLLPSPCAVVSYADTQNGHCGIVYQATNWIYTGCTISHGHLYIIDGKKVHPMTLRDSGITDPKKWAKENSIETVKPDEKHRYFYFVGDRRQKLQMKNSLKYPAIGQYPKSEKKMYDDGPSITMPYQEDLLSSHGMA